jgi:hypothetical protein
MSNEKYIKNEYENDNDDIEDLDISWINEFDKNENDYKMYYTEDISFVSVRTIYINTNNEIEKVKEEKILLKNNGILQKEELLSIIKSKLFIEKIKYSLLSILKFNVTLEPIHLKNFLKSKNQTIGTQFLQSIKHIDTIKFEKSISLFHDINEVIIIFRKKDNLNTNKSKKNNNLNTKNKKTKKIY